MLDILTYYRTGSLHISGDCCVVAFVQDLSYWGFSENNLESCCFKRYMDTKENLDWDTQNTAGDVEIEIFPPGPRGRVQKVLWDLFEHPHTSMSARVIGIVSVTCIFISTVILTLETLPYFQEHEDQTLGEFSVFAMIEAVYMSWFTLEFLVRLVCCPSKVDFLKKTMNWIDLLAIIPYYVTVGLQSYGVLDQVEDQGLQLGVGEGEEELHPGTDPGNGDVSRTAQYFRLLKLARIVKTLRIIRIFKLARHSTGLQALGNTMKSNYKELGLLFLLLGMGAIMFASLIYVFEKEDNDSTFKTMFDAYWWAIITMTTVGYGDVSPVTGMGKVIGCFCAIFGVLVIGLPIPIIGNSFNKFYARQKRWEKGEAEAKSRKLALENQSKQGKDQQDGLSRSSFRGL
ncbi:potassium voltage-gated channel protein Shab [Eurytemora carolleeae]|uniref:potassium voltage-gated channel protein Shab n=1 Tax=Eurytemora carolleeae TaxID=1294199 RepID=UPI000C763D21|nr:potassium voltage-gated channel protein Shab [Eurytemora carolleeae]|eukprot:XP_023336409.1 potassium voltage-gated channel protein Shab-like [Eurytemora affinis]